MHFCEAYKHPVRFRKAPLKLSNNSAYTLITLRPDKVPDNQKHYYSIALNSSGLYRSSVLRLTFNQIHSAFSLASPQKDASSKAYKLWFNSTQPRQRSQIRSAYTQSSIGRAISLNEICSGSNPDAIKTSISPRLRNF